MAFFTGQVIVAFQDNRLIIENPVGEGAFGKVYKVRHRKNRRCYALKVIETVGVGSRRATRGAIREVETLRRLDHDNILQVFAADNKRNFVIILTEFCSGGNLNQRLSRRCNISKKLKWMTQLASGLTYLHDQNIVHRDLKPENVLLSDRRDEDIKIGDFGLAREYLALKRVKIDDFSSFCEEYYMGTAAGTTAYMAPEVFDHHYTEKADVFSLGCIFHAILERVYVQDQHGEPYYGPFVTVDLLGNQLGLGQAMHCMPNDGHSLRFTTTRNTTTKLLIKVTRDAVQCDADDRPRAEAIRYGIKLIVSDEESF